MFDVPGWFKDGAKSAAQSVLFVFNPAASVAWRVLDATGLDDEAAGAVIDATEKAGGEILVSAKGAAIEAARSTVRGVVLTGSAALGLFLLWRVWRRR